MAFRRGKDHTEEADMWVCWGGAKQALKDYFDTYDRLDDAACDITSPGMQVDQG